MIENLQPTSFSDLCVNIQQIIESNSYTLNLTENKKPYVDKELLNFIKIKHKFAKLATRFPHADYYITKNKSYRNMVNSLIKKNKKKSLNNFFANNLTNPKATWNKLKSLLYNKEMSKEQSCEMLLESGCHVANQENIANIFNDYFVNVADSLDNRNNIENNSYENILQNDNLDITFSFACPKVTEDEIMLIISNLSNSKATDFYGISNNFVKIHKVELTSILSCLYNKSLTDSSFEDALKVGVVTPILKYGNRLDKANYRPITVLPIFSKIFEYIILRRLEEHFSANDFINTNQFGYKKGSGTETAIIF